MFEHLPTHRRRFTALLAALLVLTVGQPACGDQGSGEALYHMSCAGCHAADRSGLKRAGPDLGPASFALEESDEWLAARIHDGFKAMPPFERILTDEQTALVISYLRDGRPDPTTSTTDPPAPPTTGPQTTLPVAAATTTTTTTTGPPTSGTVATSAPAPTIPDTLALGEEIFGPDGAGCSDCHGVDGAGTADGPSLIGVSKSAISGALGGGVEDMDNIDLSRDELEAVYQYVRFLTSQR